MVSLFHGGGLPAFQEPEILGLLPSSPLTFAISHCLGSAQIQGEGTTLEREHQHQHTWAHGEAILRSELLKAKVHHLA